jgi:hypothetical protein
MTRFGVVYKTLVAADENPPLDTTMFVKLNVVFTAVFGDTV